mgnify:CR=1 FL=1
MAHTCPLDKQNLLKKARDDADLEVKTYKEKKEAEFNEYKRNVCFILFFEYLTDRRMTLLFFFIF